MTLFIDIETIPSTSRAVRKMLAAGIKPPGNMSKRESLAKWEAEAREDLIDAAMEKTALDGAFGQIFCICAAVGGFPVDDFGHGYADERGMLEQFAEYLSHFRPTNGGMSHVVVGHNVTGFDIRFIWQRCMIHGVKLPGWFPRDPKPWSDDVFDTMTRFAGPRDMVSLDKLCLAFGIPATDDISGKDVAAAYAAGDYDKIIEHCRQDVEKVRRLHKLMERAFS